jgi:hypothetical protein
MMHFLEYSKWISPTVLLKYRSDGHSGRGAVDFVKKQAPCVGHIKENYKSQDCCKLSLFIKELTTYS